MDSEYRVDSIRWLRAKINADEHHLANAPLGPIQRLRLERSIKADRAELKELNRKKREEKKKREEEKKLQEEKLKKNQQEG